MFEIQCKKHFNNLKCNNPHFRLKVGAVNKMLGQEQIPWESKMMKFVLCPCKGQWPKTEFIQGRLYDIISFPFFFIINKWLTFGCKSAFEGIISLFFFPENAPGAVTSSDSSQFTAASSLRTFPGAIRRGWKERKGQDWRLSTKTVL